LIERHQDDGVCTELYLALNKEGYLNCFGTISWLLDTQFSLQVLEGSQIRNAVGHLMSAYQVDINDEITKRSAGLGETETDDSFEFTHPAW